MRHEIANATPPTTLNELIMEVKRNRSLDLSRQKIIYIFKIDENKRTIDFNKYQFQLHLEYLYIKLRKMCYIRKKIEQVRIGRSK